MGTGWARIYFWSIGPHEFTEMMNSGGVGFVAAGTQRERRPRVRHRCLDLTTVTDDALSAGKALNVGVSESSNHIR